MEVTGEMAATRAAVAAARAAGRSIGLVPTMGYLHAGHLSLVAAARRDGHFVVASLFVNPTQFGPHEDYDRYPRDTAGDLQKCEQAGVELVFMPDVPAMYPPDAATTVHVARLTDTLCGPCRPGHFDGVATVVAKLFNIVQPDVAYFGQKDAQQLAVIRRMVRDLDFPLRIVGCPTVREPDGLAMSSRNAMLSPDERQRATALYRALTAARARIVAGEQDPATVVAAMRRLIEEADPTTIDYISIVDPETMQPLDRIGGPVLIALAVRLGATRLIDNLTVDPGGREA
ncbi:MAG: pantoate--beta-alanine ligase [Planctomycetota bacterium]